MNEDMLFRSGKNLQPEGTTATSHPSGDLWLGETSMIGRRARLLAGMVMGPAAAILAMGDAPGTTHTAV